jgi:hypothetical protein
MPSAPELVEGLGGRLTRTLEPSMLMHGIGALTRIDAEGQYHSPNVCFATESPLVHDGSQTTAAADLSSNQFYAVKVTGSRQVNLASTGGEIIYGILQNKPTSGLVADVGILGVTKAIAGAAITAGAALMTDTSGRLITATSTNHRVGIALETVTATGQVFTAYIQPLGPTA